MGASNMKKKFLILPVAVMWGCTDYAGQWEDSYGVAFAQGASTTAQVCVEGTTTALSDPEGNCTTDFICANNAWIPQNTVCKGSQQQRICDEGIGTSVVNGSCITNFLCINNAWVVYGDPICTPTPVSSSSITIPKSSSSVKRSSSSVVRSSSSKARSSSSSVKVSTAFPTWFGGHGVPRVDTRLDAGMETSGYWYAYTDDEDGGKSKVEWPVEIGNEYSELALDNVVEHCGGICGTAILDKGTLTYNPFVGIAFDVAGRVSKTSETLAAVDASSWGGVCITYRSEAAPALQLGLGDFDREIGFANPAASLPKSTAGTSKNLAWSDFKQPTWYKGDTKIDGEDAAKRLVTLKFLIQASTGKYDFNICAIGPYNGGCPSTCF